MMQHRSTQEAKYIEAFEWLQANGAAKDPAWAHALRRAAISRFNEMGFPTARRGNEEWKYTDIRPIASTHFQLSTRPVLTSLTQGQPEWLTFGQPGWNRLVFVDGAYDERLSSLPSLSSGVIVVNLARAMASSPELVERHLARYAGYEYNAFAALNTAFVHNGAFVHIPGGTQVETPIHLLFIAASPNTVSHPRVLIATGEDSSATIVESYASLSSVRYFTNAVSEVRVDPGAALRYYKVQRESEEAFHISNTHLVLSRDSSFSAVNVDLGGGLVRNNLSARIAEEGASCTLNGLYMPAGTQHIDNQVIVDHEKGHATTRELYKGVLNDKGRSVFHGSIIVREGAAKVDAEQAVKNLLLSDQAEAYTRPALWVYCDDVRCTHGAACGQIDEDALFYLKSRGLGDSAARRLLTRGFVAEVMDSIENEQLRIHIDGLVQARLREWLGDDGTP